MGADPKTKLCGWHECGQLFHVKHAHQQYCGPKCRIARNVWKARRGAPLVDQLLAKDWQGLHYARFKIIAEIKKTKGS